MDILEPGFFPEIPFFETVEEFFGSDAFHLLRDGDFHHLCVDVQRSLCSGYGNPVVSIPNEVEVPDFEESHGGKGMPLSVQGVDSRPAVPVLPLEGEEFPVEIAEAVLCADNLRDGYRLHAPVDGFTGADNLLPWDEGEETVPVVLEFSKNPFPYPFTVELVEGVHTVQKVHSLTRAIVPPWRFW